MFGYYHLRLRTEERHTYAGMATSSKGAEYLAIAISAKVEDDVAHLAVTGRVHIQVVQTIRISSLKLIAGGDGPYSRLMFRADDKLILF